MSRFPWMTILLLLFLPLSAGAVRRSAGAEGEVLIVPFFSVAEGRTSLLSIANLRDRPKAVKVRLHESLGGRTLLQFNLYLAARDSWSAILFEHEGRLALGTRDTSCTVPALVDDPQALRIGALRFWTASLDDFTGPRADAFAAVPGRTRSGHVEVFDMAEVADGGAGTAAALAFGPNAGAPADCGQLQSAFTAMDASGYWRTDAARDLVPPSGGLTAEASILHVRGGWSLEVPVTGLAEFRAAGAAILHTPPASPHPRLDDTLADPETGTAVADIVDAGGVARQLVFPRAQAIDAVSAVLAAPGVQGLFSVAPAIGAATEWVVSSPTRRFQVDPELSSGPTGAEGGTVGWFMQFGADGDRGRNGPPITCLGLPPRPECPWVNLPFSASVLVFGDSGTAPAPDGAVLPSMSRISLHGQAGGLREGRARLRFLDARGVVASLRPDLQDQVLSGAPVLGFSAVRYRFANAAPGFMAVFGDLSPLYAEAPSVSSPGATP